MRSVENLFQKTTGVFRGMLQGVCTHLVPAYSIRHIDLIAVDFGLLNAALPAIE